MDDQSYSFSKEGVLYTIQSRSLRLISIGSRAKQSLSFYEKVVWKIRFLRTMCLPGIGVSKLVA